MKDIEKYVKPDGSLYYVTCEYVEWERDSGDEIFLEGPFSIATLRAIADHVEAKMVEN